VSRGPVELVKILYGFSLLSVETVKEIIVGWLLGVVRSLLKITNT
jgi:hypothetical protein